MFRAAMIAEIVSATELSEERFWAEAPLAIHLKRAAPDARMHPRISFANSRGLPEIYNKRIDADDAADVLVFVHDDVWIEDFYFLDRVVEGLSKADVIGVVGSARRAPRQAIWAFSPETKKPDRTHLRGAVGHGAEAFAEVNFYGPTPAECELLDGLFLAARRDTLRRAGVRFDPRFAFHFYDLDFCRSARGAGLRLGVWPISMTHRRVGPPGIGTPAWKQQRDIYFEKWGD